MQYGYDNEDFDNYEGMLLKLGGGVIKRHQERWFELKNGMLHYYSAKPLGKLDLAGALLVSDDSVSWTLSGPGMRHPYTLKASSDGEKAVWISRIQRSIKKRGQRVKNFRDSVNFGAENDAFQAMTMAETPSYIPNIHLLNKRRSSEAKPDKDEPIDQPINTEDITAFKNRIDELTKERDSLQQENIELRESRLTSGGDPQSFMSTGTAVVGASPSSSSGMDGIDAIPNVLVDQVKRQLAFEREEQRVLRGDLCEEIDRLKEELRQTHYRMVTAQDQSDELLQRAVAAQSISAESSREGNLLTPRRLSPATHSRSRSCDLEINTSGIITNVSEAHLQTKLQGNMLQKYIELKKVLHDLKEMNIERVEHHLCIEKEQDDEKLGISFRRPTAVIKHVTPGLAAARFGLKPGMTVLSVDGVRTTSHDDVLAALLADKRTFHVVVSEPTAEVAARVEGNCLLAEERDAILQENDRLRDELQMSRLSAFS